ncbi:MAG: hypothetical protein AAF797_11785 [Planctomycetota bacterium]
MSSAALYYKSSGRFPSYAPVALLATGAVVGIVGGAIYGLAVWYIPIIYLNILLTIGLALLAGGAVLGVSRWTHTRNGGLVLIAGLLAGVAALYASWVGWLWALSEREVLVLDPREIWYVMQAISENGLWSIGSSGTPVSGLALWAVWFIEAAMIVAGAAGVAFVGYQRTPYSESAKAWMTDTETLPPLAPIADHAAFRRGVEGSDFGILTELGPVPEGTDTFTLYDLISVPNDNREHLLTVTSVTLTANKKGEIQENRKPVVNRLIIDAETRELLSQIIRDTTAEQQARIDEGAEAHADQAEASDA